MRGALDCVAKISPTGSTEVFTVDMSSSTALHERRTDPESQSAKSHHFGLSHSIWWHVALDIPLLLLLLIPVGLFELGVIPSHKSGFYCNDPAISFPFTGDTVSTGVLMSTLLLMPPILIFLTELCTCNSEDSTRSRLTQSSWNCLGITRSYILGFLVNMSLMELMKGIVGGHRPTFISLCDPDTAKNCTGTEYVSTFTCTSTIHSAWLQMDASRSFPSGHTSLSVYCGCFLAWYLQKRAFNWRHRTVLLVPFLQTLCICYSIICSLTRITDHRHHWWDVCVGTLLGLIVTYYTVILCDNFRQTKKTTSLDTKLEESQHTINTLVFNERPS